MNRYTQGAPAKTFHAKKKKKLSGEDAYSQASTGAGSSNPVDATTLGGPPGVGMGGGPPGVDPPAAGMQMHASGSPGTTAQTTVRTQPEFHATGGLELRGPDGQLPELGPERMMHATGSPATEPTPQEMDEMAKKLGLSPLQLRAMRDQLNAGGSNLTAQTSAAGSPLQQQALIDAAAQARGAGQQMPGEMDWQRDKRLAQQEVADGAYDPTAQQRVADGAYDPTALSPLQQQHVEEREQVKPPEERISLDEFAKSADLVSGLSPSDQAEATRILKEQGQGAFATFVAARSVGSETGGLKVDAVTVQSLNDAKTAFAQGGFEDFFKAHDQFQVLSNPNASEEEKSAATAAMEEVLANPNPDANPRIVKTDNFQTGNDALDKALSIVAGAGTSGTINEAELEGLDEETQAVVRNVTNKIKLRADAAGQNFDEAKQRALAKERTGDLGSGMSGNIANPPDNWSNEQKAGHWLNQMLAAARGGEFNNSWKDTLAFAFRDVGLTSDSAWAKIESAFNNYTSSKHEAVSSATANASDSISIEEGEGEGGDTLTSFVGKRREALGRESEVEDAEIAKNKEVLKSLDTLLAGGQVSEEALASLPPEMTDRVRNIQVQSREYEIARRESALLQQFDEYEEGERQRTSANAERDRLKAKAPSLTLDVAGEFQPPGTMERVASVEEKIDRGGQLTGQDMIGLPADQQRRLQDRSTSAINRMTNVDEANAEIQLEARRRMLDPFTAAGGASIYGQGNAHQTFGRNVMSGVEQRIAQTLNDITVSADRERAGRKGAINSQYDQAIHKLSRIFATTPDKLGGAAQRRFEELEAERSNALSGVDIEVDRAVRDEQRTNIELLTGLQESREAAALGAEELNLNALGQAAGFAGGLDDRALREAEVYGRGTLSGEIQRGQLGLGERETSLREAEMFGGTEGVNLGQLTTLDVPFVIGQDGQLAPGVSQDEFFRAQTEIEDGFRNRFGRDATAGEVMSIMQGQSVGARTTLGAELGRGGLEETETERAERQKLDRDRLGLEQEIERGRLSETVDARTGAQELDTSAQELDRQRLGLEQEIGLGRLGLERAELFGGADSITLGQIGDFGFDTLLNPDGSVVTGVDQGAFMEASSRIEEGFNQRYGRSPSASEMTRIMQGEEVGGRSTLAASEAQSDRRLQAETATGTITIDGKRQQTLQDFIERGELTNETSALFADQLGYVRDPETGERVSTLAGRASDLQDKGFTESTRQFNAEFFGNMIDPETGKVREGLDAKEVATQITQFNRQMANSERELTANIGQTWASITGQTGTPAPVSADDFGVDISAMKDVNPMMWRNTQEYKRVADGIQSMTGQAATEDQVMNILSGQDAMIDGAPTMEARELSTRVVQANMDRAVQVNQFAKEIGLSRDQFEGAEEAADREWQMTTQDVAAIYGLDQEDWAQARSQFERNLSSGMSNLEATEAAARRSGLSVSEFSQANSMFEERWGQKSRMAAIEIGLTEDQWEQTKAAQKEMTDRENQYWDGVMENVGNDVNVSTLMRKLPVPQVGDEGFPQELSDQTDTWVDQLLEPYGDDESDRNFGKDTGAVRVGLRQAILRDPENTLKAILGLQQMMGGTGGSKATNEQIERAANEYNLPREVVATFIGSGKGREQVPVTDEDGKFLRNEMRNVSSRYNIEQIRESFLADDSWRTYEETASPSATTLESPEKVAGMLEEFYDMTPEEAAEAATNLVGGGTMRLPPRDWLANMEPELRMEVLSLMHGGTTFAIAQKSPSLGETIGQFAGMAAGQFAGGAGAALFDGLFGEKKDPSKN